MLFSFIFTDELHNIIQPVVTKKYISLSKKYKFLFLFDIDY